METKKQISHVRELARKLHDAAGDPRHARNIERWKRHNALESSEPLVLIFPEGSWEELIPESRLVCTDPELRTLEYDIRKRLYYASRLKDDNPIVDEVVVTKRVLPLDWGLNPHRVYSETARGAYEVNPVLIEEADADRLKIPEIHYDEEGTLAAWNLIGDAVGDILPVRLKGEQFFAFHLTAMYVDWRGLENMLLDFYLQPELIRRVMTFLVEAYRSMLDAKLAKGLISRNSDWTHHSSGGNSWIGKELTGDSPIQGPAATWGSALPPADSEPVQLKQLWASAESQELAVVSPEQHHDFIMRHEAEILDRFGLAGYGCCEDLTRKIGFVTKSFQNLRRISISPWADVEACAEQLGDRYIYSWKPHPAWLVGNFDEAGIRMYIRKALAATRKEGNILEIILKDTHTCEHQPERFDAWLRIVREEIAAS